MSPLPPAAVVVAKLPSESAAPCLLAKTHTALKIAARSEARHSLACSKHVEKTFTHSCCREKSMVVRACGKDAIVVIGGDGTSGSVDVADAVVSAAASAVSSPSPAKEVEGEEGRDVFANICIQGIMLS